MAARRSGCWIGGVVVGLGCLVGVAWCFGLFTGTMMTFPRPFSAAAWKQADVHFGYERCRMTMDLRYRIGLIGRTPTEIIALLGDEREGRPGPPTGYVLCPTLADYRVLELQWRDGHVVSTRIYQS